jgi:hypothetical protein
MKNEVFRRKRDMRLRTDDTDSRRDAEFDDITASCVREVQKRSRKIIEASFVLGYLDATIMLSRTHRHEHVCEKDHAQAYNLAKYIADGEHIVRKITLADVYLAGHGRRQRESEVERAGMKNDVFDNDKEEK